MDNKVPLKFNPNIFYPTYLIRNGLYKNIKSMAPELKGKMLDLGCGIKPYESLFSVERYIGVEYYGEGETYDKGKADFFYDGKTLPFEDNYFDSAFCSEVFEHVFNFEEILKELNRVLKPKSKMLITCPFIFPEHEAPNDFARYTYFALKHLLEKNGFRIIKFIKSGSFTEVGSQLRILHYEYGVHKYVNKIPVLRSLIKYFIYFTNNAWAIVTRSLFPGHKEMYLTNIALAEKI